MQPKLCVCVCVCVALQRKLLQSNGFEDPIRKKRLDARLVVASNPHDLIEQMIAKKMELSEAKL